MAGKRGRSGPPGNLNAASRPWRSFWRRRALGPADKWVAPMLDHYRAGLQSDKPDMSETAWRLAEIAMTARGCTMLILSQVREAGFIRTGEDGWDLHPGAKELPRFMAIERGALQTLGLERQARYVDPLEAVRAAVREANR